jgi:hypothetical protein
MQNAEGCDRFKCTYNGHISKVANMGSAVQYKLHCSYIMRLSPTDIRSSSTNQVPF